MWPPHDSVETTRYFLADAMLAWTEGVGHRAWVLEERGTIDAVPIGMIGTTVSGHSVEVGYVLSPTYQARGYMTEALSAVTECALSEQAIARVWATCHVDNKASQRVLERCGYTLEGCLKKSGYYPNLVPPICDSLMFAKVR